jgi:hypothetical protein
VVERPLGVASPSDNGPAGYPAALLIVRRGRLKFVRSKPSKTESYKDFYGRGKNGAVDLWRFAGTSSFNREVI